ncbi:MAG: endolytic transglycosylase MltG [bacterium]
MIRRIAIIGAGVVIVAAAILAAAVLRSVYTRPTVPGPEAESLLFTIASGESFASVTARLSDRGMIRSRLAVKVYAWIRRYDRRIKAGTYSIPPGDTPHDILGRFVHGDIYRVSVTVPEGLMHKEIAGVLAKEADIDSTSFALLSSDPAVLEKLGVDAPSLEGYLFPDTYVVPWAMAPIDAAGMMVRRLDEVYDGAMRERARAIGMSRREVLTLASIVQAETRLPEELPLVAAVYHNRLRRGMRLEADPTVAYAMGGYRGRLYFKDLEIDSPYNTYRYPGLPPGPICSPGEAAINATLYPDSTCRAIYFVAEGGGGHIFSLTLKEHLSAVQKVRKSKAARKSGSQSEQ